MMQQLQQQQQQQQQQQLMLQLMMQQQQQQQQPQIVIHSLNMNVGGGSHTGLTSLGPSYASRRLALHTPEREATTSKGRVAERPIDRDLIISLSRSEVHSEMNRANLPCWYTVDGKGICNVKEDETKKHKHKGSIKLSDNDMKSSKVPVHMLGFLSGKFPSTSDATKGLSHCSICSACNNQVRSSLYKTMVCCPKPTDRKNAPCLCCYETGGSGNLYCSDCSNKLTGSVSGFDAKHAFLKLWMRALELKLKFTSPSWAIHMSAEKATEETTKGDRRTTKRIDLFVDARTSTHISLIAVEMVTSADIEVASLKAKVKLLMKMDENHPNCHRTLFMMYFDRVAMESQLVLCRQLINALIVDMRMTESDEKGHVNIVTFGDMPPRKSEGTVSKWTELRQSAGVTDVTTVKHYGPNYSPKATMHGWLYHIHPAELAMLKQRSTPPGQVEWSVDDQVY